MRIVDDDLFFRVRARLAKLAVGPRPRRLKPDGERRLCDLIVNLFRCPYCRRRFHVCGAGNGYMRCPDPQCPAPAMVCRADATGRLCAWLAGALTADAAPVDDVLGAFAGLPDDEAADLDE